MRAVVTLVATAIGLSISSTVRAQTHNVSEWRVAPEMGSFATIITLDSVFAASCCVPPLSRQRDHDGSGDQDQLQS